MMGGTDRWKEAFCVGDDMRCEGHGKEKALLIHIRAGFAKCKGR